METLKIDVLNNKAIKLLKDLEKLQLIRVHKEQQRPAKINWSKKYKGAMAKQTTAEIDRQLNELRQECE